MRGINRLFAAGFIPNVVATALTISGFMAFKDASVYGPGGATTGAGAVVTRGAKVGKDQVWVGIPARELGGSKGSDFSGAKK